MTHSSMDCRKINLMYSHSLNIKMCLTTLIQANGTVSSSKTKMNVCCQFKSLERREAYASIHSIVQTSLKNGQDPYLALIAVAEIGAVADCH